MKLFALGLCSILFGGAGILLMPFLPNGGDYIWYYLFCVVMGFLCQLMALRQIHLSRKAIIERMKEEKQWQADIHQRYVGANGGEESVKIIKEVLRRFGNDAHGERK